MPHTYLRQRQPISAASRELSAARLSRRNARCCCPDQAQAAFL